MASQRLGRIGHAGRWVAGAAAAGGLAAVGVAASKPAVREEARRLSRLARPLGEAAEGPPLPPELPAGRTVVLPGRGEVFVRDSGGTGPVVLLLHGWGVTADVNFFNVFPALSPAYRSVALDHRGHGRGLRAAAAFSLEDCADDAAALVEALGAGRVTAVGYSMGGPVAMLLAHRHPQLVASLVLAATALEFHDDLREQAVWRGLTVVEAVLRHGSGDSAVQRVLREAIEKEPSLDGYRAWLAGEFRRGHIQAIIEAGRALAKFDARPFAADIRARSAVVLTTGDRLVPPRKQRALAKALRASTFELDGDHDVPISGGRAFGKVMRTAVDHVT